MSYFSKFRPYYYVPERLSPSEIARRRVERLVGLAEREISRVEALQDARRERLYPGEARLIEQRKAILRDAIASHVEAVEPLRRVRKSNRLLYAAIAGHLQRERMNSSPLSRGAFDRAKASAAASGKYYDPASAVRFNRQAIGNRYVNAALSRAIKRLLPNVSGGVMPCIERTTRREVLFARGHGGKGHRVPHRILPSSFVRC